MRATDTGPAVPKAAVERKEKTKRAAIQGGVLFVAALSIIVFGMIEHTHTTVYFGFAAGMVAAGRIPFSELAAWAPWSKG